jgi:hypothetical protein
VNKRIYRRPAGRSIDRAVRHSKYFFPLPFSLQQGPRARPGTVRETHTLAQTKCQQCVFASPADAFLCLLCERTRRRWCLFEKDDSQHISRSSCRLESTSRILFSIGFYVEETVQHQHKRHRILRSGSSSGRGVRHACCSFVHRSIPMAAREARSHGVVVLLSSFLAIYIYVVVRWTRHPIQSKSQSVSRRTLINHRHQPPRSRSSRGRDGPAEQQDGRGGGVPRRPRGGGGRVRLLRRLLPAVRQRQGRPRLHEDVHGGVRRRRQGQCRRRRCGRRSHQQALSFNSFAFSAEPWSLITSLSIERPPRLFLLLLFNQLIIGVV